MALAALNARPSLAFDEALEGYLTATLAAAGHEHDVALWGDP